MKKKIKKLREEAVKEMETTANKQNKKVDAIFGLTIKMSEIAAGQSNAMMVCKTSGTPCIKIQKGGKKSKKK